VTVPALEIGGSHVSAAAVAPSGAVGPVARAGIDGSADAATLLGAIIAVAAQVATPGPIWGIAIPGPFDYEAGVGRYRDVGKFEALDGVDVGAALRAGLNPAPGGMHFVNDAIAFALGEWGSGPAHGLSRVVALTLGTGIGSAFLDGGRPVTTGSSVPPEGRADLLTSSGRPLEDIVSTRGLLAAGRGRGMTVTSVAGIARRAAAGDCLATDVLATAYHTLGATLSPYIHAFQAEVLVLGGGMSAARALIEPPLREGLNARDLLITYSPGTEASALRGAAIAVRRAGPGRLRQRADGNGRPVAATTRLAAGLGGRAGYSGAGSASRETRAGQVAR
jgi:glucokinase